MAGSGGQESGRKAMQPEKSAWKRDGRRDGRPRFARLIIAVCSSLRSLQTARPSCGFISHDDRYATARWAVSSCACQPLRDRRWRCWHGRNSARWRACPAGQAGASASRMRRSQANGGKRGAAGGRTSCRRPASEQHLSCRQND